MTKPAGRATQTSLASIWGIARQTLAELMSRPDWPAGRGPFTPREVATLTLWYARLPRSKGASTFANILARTARGESGETTRTIPPWTLKTVREVFETGPLREYRKCLNGESVLDVLTSADFEQLAECWNLADEMAGDNTNALNNLMISILGHIAKERFTTLGRPVR
jgi:hypothetical protein